MKNKNLVAIIIIAVLLISVVAIWQLTAGGQELAGTIEIDGSSTVFPITQAVAEEFQKEHPDVRVNVGVSGTGGGFKRFQVGETDINDASRPIKSSEAEACAANGIEYIEFTIAIDGLAVMVNPQNTWVDYLTVEELNMIWKPDSTVDNWNDVRPEWPDQPIRLYGPDTDSGTFDYFTDVINGDEGVSRSDYTASADDNVLVQGIAGDQNSLGYFGYAYYAENTDKLKIVPIDGGNGPVIPSDATVKAGQYSPLARPIFIYVNKASLDTDVVKLFVTFYMENAEQLVAEVGYTPQPSSVYQQNLDLF
jgi:phosphate transport system substrate-binding protein